MPRKRRSFSATFKSKVALGLAKQLMSGLGLIPMIEICDDGMYAGCTSREMDR